ncbi:GNAT family N-acetyltransferase [Micromonospora sp. WMMD558]|uniref:GNAT family N-acetyltransferase n=1 Tax=unclassified Micromonospora TaxID=2617518 RepID=UPI0012B47B97|nr:GNAT family N-acetyltransferase [Micromonospora sp. WMMC415]QGN49505.1 GNAT family N-acetyltransferase [Micromonospora sp. WMMC415]
MTPEVRTARPDDAPAVTALIGELGYPAETGEVHRRLATLPPGHVVLVSVEGEQVTGWLHARHGTSLVHGDRLEIVGLVVAADRRGAGEGGSLLVAAEEWARDRGLTAAQVLSGSERNAAHAFYRGRGFRAVKTEQVFVKSLVGER